MPVESVRISTKVSGFVGLHSAAAIDFWSFCWPYCITRAVLPVPLSKSFAKLQIQTLLVSTAALELWGAWHDSTPQALYFNVGCEILQG